MSRLSQCLSIASTCLLLLAAASCGGGGGGGGGPSMTTAVDLQVASGKSSYAQGEEISLLLTLVNTGDTDAAVTTAFESALEVVSFLRNGSAVTPATKTGVFEETPAATQTGALHTLAPGEHTSGPLVSVFLGTTEGQVLSFHASDADGGAVLSDYDVTPAGTYTVELRYRYGGTVPQGTNVFQGPTSAATVVFDVQP